MSTLSATTSTRTVQPPQAHAKAQDLATRLLNGTLHASYPPVEKFLTIDGLLRSHAEEPDAGQRPLICYPIRGANDFEEHTAKDLDRYTDVAVQHYMDNGLPPADPSLEEAPVVALLVGSSFEVIVTFFALNRMGYAVLFLSTRLPGDALARLMNMAKSHLMVVTRQYRTTFGNICKERPGCREFPMLQRMDWFNRPAPATRFTRDTADLVKESQKMAWILHSSGSTGFPKPIFLTNYQVLANYRKSFGLRLFNISPLFHSHGLMEIMRAFYTRATAYIGNHSLPVTYQTLYDALEVAKPEQISAVPFVIKLLAEKQEGITALAQAELVLFGGSSFPDDLGDRLVSQGVNLVANYGATETGQIMTSFRNAGDTEWQYMRLHPPVADFTLMDEISPGVFECVGLDGLPSKGPSNSKPPYSEKNPANSFRTADLFTRHPDPRKSNFYKYLSRLDDRITLVNGEKVLPIPIEGRVREEELVGDCVVFGFQRTVPGALIFRAPGKAAHLSDEEFLERIWPAIEAANSRAESFSQIPKELVVVKGADVTYPRTDKGTCIRAQVYQQFDEDIKAAYAAFEGSGEAIGSLALSIPELETWLMCRFHDDLDVPLESVDADIFSAGVDSLQTTRIWRSIVRDIDLGDQGKSLSQNIVFEKGSIRALARHLYQMRNGEETDQEDEVPVMRELIEKYSRFAHHIPTLQHQPAAESVLVTGGTGNLGAFIIAELCVCSLGSCRAPGQASAGARITKALADRDIALTDDEAAKIRALPSDLSQANLGLDNYIVDHLLSSLTGVIHSAWAINFNLGVRSFEQQHIRGTYNLINFCLRSELPVPPRFYFCSSVSTASNTPKPASIPETMVEDLAHAQTTGYGRSKLVTEHITRNAMHHAGIYARVLRIGQLGGDTRSARWNDTEAIALMFRSTLTTGSLPALEERPSWLPVDQCAQAITDISLTTTSSSQEENLVYHLVNPHSFSWKNDLLPALKKGSALPPFEVVSPQEWLKKLAGSDQDPEKKSQHQIYSGQNGGQSENAGLVFETKRTTQDCPSLALVKDPVAEGLIHRYISVWMSRWTDQ
ncbi:hypothetical protein N7468_002817 [Penicillium chermesinum]|uniref:Carrier domain-containing protein n=1 Tax=Penicillium chermesinum TaxID=63820 RepID=A0A9W9PJ88_9EURO|nr:uncharacterized protein N7468_002817 [Penicillium chermesinum]KAJ5247834.1 hypothetical protein N7468_002817 [Penicillium chermesinum]